VDSFAVIDRTEVEMKHVRRPETTLSSALHDSRQIEFPLSRLYGCWVLESLEAEAMDRWNRAAIRWKRQRNAEDDVVVVPLYVLARRCFSSSPLPWGFLTGMRGRSKNGLPVDSNAA
jgi:hypothetical protein